MSEYLNVGTCNIEESETEDIDWVNNWKQYFHQFYIDDLLVIPSWEEVPEEEDIPSEEGTSPEEHPPESVEPPEELPPPGPVTTTRERVVSI